MHIEKYCQCILSSIKLRGLSFFKDYISSSLHPRSLPFYRDLISRMGQFQFFFKFQRCDREKTLGRRQRSLMTMFFDTFAIRNLKRVYHMRKLLITYEEAWKLPEFSKKMPGFIKNHMVTDRQ